MYVNQRLREYEKDQIAEYVESLYRQKYRTLPHITYTPNGINISLHLYPVLASLSIYKNNGLYNVNYIKYYNLDQEAPLNEEYQFDDINDVYDFIDYAVNTMKPPIIDY